MKFTKRSTSKEERFVTPSDAAKKVHLSVGTLANHRMERKGLPYVKLGGRVLYDINDIVEYLEKKKIRHD